MSFSSDIPLQANQIPVSIDYPNIEDDEFLDVLVLDRKQVGAAINTKEGALYQLQEQATFQQYYTVGNPQALRPVYRTVVDFGTLPNAGVKTVAHNIPFDSNYRTTRIFGSATDPTGLVYIPLPFCSPVAATNIELYITSANVVIATGSNRTNFTICSIVIEYIKY